MLERKVELLSIFSKMIHEYERKNTPLCFSFKKIGFDFFFTGVNEALLKAANLSAGEIIGMNLYNDILPEKFSHQLYKIYEEAWKGSRVFYYILLPTNKDVLFACILKPVRNEGEIVEVKGHCVPLNANELHQFRRFFNNVGPFERMYGMEYLE
ncbi:hypothetical protein [Aneurinibacillus tyrosinisolvens]|uniref:hypothetical protein n=1 Tax=Aneurinibacillus tyrosinisolvens TaxID=1443435 RepID=UPI00063F1CCA|nr:hypothetical protein [Aneurinibacillus tyrosinisolvens]